MPKRERERNTDASAAFREQVESLYAVAVEIAALHDLSAIYDRALTQCLALTASEMGFIDLVNDDRVDMEVVAVKGFQPTDPKFFERFAQMPVRSSIFGSQSTTPTCTGASGR